MTTTETGPVGGQARGTLSFQGAPYPGGPVHFFLNALDGQTYDDSFYLNDIAAGGAVAGTGNSSDACPGLLGLGATNNMYDQADDANVASFLSPSDEELTFRTVNTGDCIGHSFGAISYAAACVDLPFVDCNGNTINDACDLANRDSEDCQPNGLLDECEIADATSADCQPNNVPDECDIANGTSRDCQPNGIPDECEPDADSDGVPDDCDNCPTVPNPWPQADTDGDGVGDECDTCPTVYDPGQSNQDGDYWQDACDNCPTVWNYWQQDADADGVGDACDNCPDVSNPDQADTDQDGIGDACEGEGMMLLPGGGPALLQAEGMEEEGSSAQSSRFSVGGSALAGMTGGVSASFVEHGTGAASVTLPPQGGTVVVDLVLAAGDPVSSFSLKPAVSSYSVTAVSPAAVGGASVSAIGGRASRPPQSVSTPPAGPPRPTLCFR